MGNFRALTVAGSDSSAGAGIQADLKTFSALGVYVQTVVTAVVAESARRVLAVVPVDPEIVQMQLSASLDLGFTAGKTGMLVSGPIIDVVADFFERHAVPLVVDPVMTATAGGDLLSEDGITNMVERLFPLCTVLTPNVPEASRLLGMPILDDEDVRSAARCLRALGPQVVVMKGGHRQDLGKDDVVDVVFDGEKFRYISEARGPELHGTGCVLSAAIAAWLAKGESPLSAVEKGRAFLAQRYPMAPFFGRGRGPVL